MSMIEPTLTDAEVNALPLDERIQIALHEAFGNEDEAATAYEAIEPLLATVYAPGTTAASTARRKMPKSASATRSAVSGGRGEGRERPDEVSRHDRAATTGATPSARFVPPPAHLDAPPTETVLLAQAWDEGHEAPALAENPYRGDQPDGMTDSEYVKSVVGKNEPAHRLCWMDGWREAMDWLAEYKGAEGIALAKEMSTRLPIETVTVTVTVTDCG